ncbi:hypothetical protein [Olleya sp. HaHaR_3_96]|uniref:hypothetical protein n=1 Tax=Olleya sp. HaHaR_3_96 TaxID=2745560 RepID=UPI001C4FD1BD|nr:hypothetical protein [Olleya sp. HaHaR_3_96]QXP58996.1 hypothetical protein H0I26_13870 [Olleya sp. HaHaR_3_96]
MKKQILMSSLLFFLIITSCRNKEHYAGEAKTTETAITKFENNILAFNFPEDWNITESEEIEKGIFYLSVEKEGLDSSGIMTIISFENLIELDESIMMNIAELQNNSLIQNLNFDTIKDSKFNAITARALHFNFKTIGIKHEGIIYAFSNATNSVVILKQEALEDQKENVDGFSTIENSFKMK